MDTADFLLVIHHILTVLMNLLYGFTRSSSSNMLIAAVQATDNRGSGKKEENVILWLF